MPERGRRRRSSHLQASAAADSSGNRSSPPPPPVAAIITESSDGASVEESSGGSLEGSAAPERGVSVVVDVGGGDGGPAEPEAEEVYRICHLSPKIRGSGGAELIRIGCGCKGQLRNTPHRCVEAWFRVKGNRFYRSGRRLSALGSIPAGLRGASDPRRDIVRKRGVLSRRRWAVVGVCAQSVYNSFS